MNKPLYVYIPMVLLLTWIMFQIGGKIADRYLDAALQREPAALWGDVVCTQDADGNYVSNRPGITCDVGNTFTILTITGKVLMEEPFDELP